MARGDALNKLYHLGKYSPAALAGPKPAALTTQQWQAELARGAALNERYGLGANADSGDISAVPTSAPQRVVSVAAGGFDWGGRHWRRGSDRARAARYGDGGHRSPDSPVAAVHAELARLIPVGTDPLRGSVPSETRYSYWSDSSTLSFDARRAGRIAAIRPAADRDERRVHEQLAGDRERDALVGQRLRHHPGEEDPERQAHRGADQRRHDRLSRRIIRRTCRRVIPTARSIPSSRVRSKTESTSVFTMPNS